MFYQQSTDKVGFMNEEEQRSTELGKILDQFVSRLERFLYSKSTDLIHDAEKLEEVAGEVKGINGLPSYLRGTAMRLRTEAGKMEEAVEKYKAMLTGQGGSVNEETKVEAVTQVSETQEED